MRRRRGRRAPCRGRPPRPPTARRPPRSGGRHLRRPCRPRAPRGRRPPDRRCRRSMRRCRRRPRRAPSVRRPAHGAGRRAVRRRPRRGRSRRPAPKPLRTHPPGWCSRWRWRAPGRRAATAAKRTTKAGAAVGPDGARQRRPAARRTAARPAVVCAHARGLERQRDTGVVPRDRRERGAGARAATCGRGTTRQGVAAGRQSAPMRRLSFSKRQRPLEPSLGGLERLRRADQVRRRALLGEQAALRVGDREDHREAEQRGDEERCDAALPMAAGVAVPVRARAAQRCRSPKAEGGSSGFTAGRRRRRRRCAAGPSGAACARRGCRPPHAPRSRSRSCAPDGAAGTPGRRAGRPASSSRRGRSRRRSAVTLKRSTTSVPLSVSACQLARPSCVSMTPLRSRKPCSSSASTMPFSPCRRRRRRSASRPTRRRPVRAPCTGSRRRRRRPAARRRTPRRPSSRRGAGRAPSGRRPRAALR